MRKILVLIGNERERKGKKRNAMQSRTSGGSAADYADEKGLLEDVVVFQYSG